MVPRQYRRHRTGPGCRICSPARCGRVLAEFDGDNSALLMITCVVCGLEKEGCLSPQFRMADKAAIQPGSSSASINSAWTRPWHRPLKVPCAVAWIGVREVRMDASVSNSAMSVSLPKGRRRRQLPNVAAIIAVNTPALLEACVLLVGGHPEGATSRRFLSLNRMTRPWR